MRKDWLECSISELLEIERGGSPRPIKNYITSDEDGINWIKIGDTKGVTKYIKETREKIKPSGLKKSRLVNPGDFILSNSMSFGKPFIMDTTGAIHDGWLVLRDGYKVLDKNFLYYTLSSPGVYKQFSNLATGSTVKNLNISLVSKVKIKLLPLPEQRAIVSKIEQLFSSLDHGIAQLKTVQAQLRVYRQAVLKKAFEGELTKEWRARQTDLPTAAKVAKSIKKEREVDFSQRVTKWEKVLEEWKAGGEVGKKPGKPMKLKFVNTLSKEEKKEKKEKLPKEWDWAKIGNVCTKISDGPFGSNLKSADYVEKGIRVVRLENIKNLYFENSKKSFVSEEKYKTIAKHTVYTGDIVFSTFIADEIKVTRIPKEIPFAIHKADCLCIRPTQSVNNQYLEYLLSTRYTYNQLVNLVHGATRPRINTTQLKEVAFPLCSLEEQIQVVQEIESRLSVCDKIAETVEISLKKSESLRQSILKRAFAGELLTAAELERCRAEEDWEPAADLLKRIRAEKGKLKK